MHDRPDAKELLSIARETLMNAILPALPAASKYDALMIANALAIATREIELQAANVTREGERLDVLANAAGIDAPSQASLCASIRAGAFDNGEKRAALLDYLSQSIRDRVAVSNPKVLP